VNAYRAVVAAGTATTDTTSPVVFISSPAQAATVSGTIQIQGTATDNVGVTTIQSYVDNRVVTTASASPFSFSWNTVNAANGTHSLQVTALGCRWKRRIRYRIRKRQQPGSDRHHPAVGQHREPYFRRQQYPLSVPVMGRSPPRRQTTWWSPKCRSISTTFSNAPTHRRLTRVIGILRKWLPELTRSRSRRGIPPRILRLLAPRNRLKTAFAPATGPQSCQSRAGLPDCSTSPVLFDIGLRSSWRKARISESGPKWSGVVRQHHFRGTYHGRVPTGFVNTTPSWEIYWSTCHMSEQCVS
jgi:hypothetical protein